MTSRERVLAAARGGEVDRRPVFGYPDPVANGDIVLTVTPEGLASQINGEQVVLSVVDSPFRKCGDDFAKEFQADPTSASEVLDRIVDETRSEMAQALEAGADGIFYRLYGARESRSTPMEYGGLYLERDRELLEGVREANLNVLFLVGNDDLYFDFVSDLPAHVIAWDRDATGIDAAQVRGLRIGAQASSDPASEIHLEHRGVRIADQIDCC